jgi:hypothetical protein
MRRDVFPEKLWLPEGRDGFSVAAVLSLSATVLEVVEMGALPFFSPPRLHHSSRLRSQPERCREICLGTLHHVIPSRSFEMGLAGELGPSVPATVTRLNSGCRYVS